MPENRNPRVQDPVCGRTLEIAEVVAMIDRGGWAHFFCSIDCRDTFNRDPERFDRNMARATIGAVSEKPEPTVMFGPYGPEVEEKG